MQCVILAAGKGTRLLPLTAHTPKPLIEVCGKAILQHIVEALPAEVNEIVLVVSYLEEQIRAFCGDVFCGKRVQYVTQRNPVGGTGDALLCAKPLLLGRFLVLNGDDIYGKEAIEKALEFDWAILAAVSQTPERFGVLVPNTDGTLKEIIEKPQNPPSNYVNINGLVINNSIFDYTVPASSTGELYVTDMVNAFVKDHPLKIVEQTLWLPIGYPDDIEKAERILNDQKN